MTMKFRRSTKSLLPFVAIAALTAAVPATAAEPPVKALANQTPTEEPEAEGSRLSIEQIIAKVKEQGYPEVSAIDLKGDWYCVEASNASGSEFELHVNAKTGEITLSSGVQD